MNRQEAVRVLSETKDWMIGSVYCFVYTQPPAKLPEAIDFVIKELSGTEQSEGKLHPLHVRLIRCITPKAKCDTPRDVAEMRAWDKVKGWLKEKHVDSVEQFYKAEKADNDNADETWKRKHGVSALLNQLGEQIDLADSFNFKTKPKKERINEPKGWRIAADCIANQPDCAPELRKEIVLTESWRRMLPHVQSMILEQLNKK